MNEPFDDDEDDGPDRYFAIRQCVGTSVDDCRIVLDRSDDMAIPEEEQEVVIVRRAGGRAYTSFVSRGCLYCVWTSPSGRLWAAGQLNGRYGLFSGEPDAAGMDRLDPIDLPDQKTLVKGVFGSQDDVFAWGGGFVHTPMTWHFDGRSWRAIEAPGRVLDVHGPAPDLVHAVGEAGMVARWVGGAWRSYAAPTQLTIRRVCVADADRMFACGSSSAYVGSTHGWVHRAEHHIALDDVAVWQGEAIFATSENLTRLDGPRLVPFAPEPALQLEASETHVLARHSSMIYDTTDFTGFRFVTDTELARLAGAMRTNIRRV